MDYKSNMLKSKAEINDQLISDFPEVYFGMLQDSNLVFDYSRYFEETGKEYIDYKIFMRANRHFIEHLVKESNKKTSELFYQNTDGHILVAYELVFLFLAFIDENICQYFNHLISDVLTDGFAFSNGFVFELSAKRVPTEVMQEIIKDRTNEPGGN